MKTFELQTQEGQTVSPSDAKVAANATDFLESYDCSDTDTQSAARQYVDSLNDAYVAMHFDKLCKPDFLSIELLDRLIGAAFLLTRVHKLKTPGHEKSGNATTNVRNRSMESYEIDAKAGKPITLSRRDVIAHATDLSSKFVNTDSEIGDLVRDYVNAVNAISRLYTLPKVVGTDEPEEDGIGRLIVTALILKQAHECPLVTGALHTSGLPG